MDYNYSTLVPTMNVVTDVPKPCMILFTDLPQNDFKILFEEVAAFFNALAINTTKTLSSIIDDYSIK